MKQKRIVCLLLSILILFLFSACSNPDSVESNYNITAENTSVSEQEATKADNKDVTEISTDKRNKDKETGTEKTTENTTQDKYKTAPVPAGKPKPVEPQKQTTTKKAEIKTTNKAGNTTNTNTTVKKANTCTIYIEC